MEEKTKTEVTVRTHSLADAAKLYEGGYISEGVMTAFIHDWNAIKGHFTVAFIDGGRVRNEEPDKLKSMPRSVGQRFKFWPLVWLTAMLAWVGTITGAAAPITEQQAVQAILGEARGESDHGMLAVACAIRNRNSLRGVYGFSAKFTVTPALRDRAVAAWRFSAGCDIVGNADHWESTDFKKPKWAAAMVQTVTVGKHVFYRSKAQKCPRLLVPVSYPSLVRIAH